jgi:large subunit ribosomal protein L22
MATSTAQLNDYRQSPRKVRIVTDLIRGKRTDDAIAELAFLGKRAASPIQKLIISAVSNARGKNMDVETLVVKDIRVDAGKILYRRLPASRGRSSQLRKRTSHVVLTLEEKEPKVKKVKFDKKAK